MENCLIAGHLYFGNFIYCTFCTFIYRNCDNNIVMEEFLRFLYSVKKLFSIFFA